MSAAAAGGLVAAGHLANEARMRVDRDGTQPLEQIRAAAEDAADVERVVCLGELQDRTAVGAERDVPETQIGQPYGVADDALENLVEVEARDDRLVHLPAGELRTSVAATRVTVERLRRWTRATKALATSETSSSASQKYLRRLR